MGQHALSAIIMGCTVGITSLVANYFMRGELNFLLALVMGIAAGVAHWALKNWQGNRRPVDDSQ